MNQHIAWDISVFNIFIVHVIVYVLTEKLISHYHLIASKPKSTAFMRSVTIFPSMHDLELKKDWNIGFIDMWVR